MDGDGVVTTKHELGVVLIHGNLGISDSWHVLDDNAVVNRVTVLVVVQQLVGLDHVVNDRGLGDLLGSELLGSRQVETVVVTQMVVRSDGKRLDTGIDQELGKDGLELGLARLEVITSNVGALSLGKLDAAGNKGVLGEPLM